MDRAIRQRTSEKIASSAVHELETMAFTRVHNNDILYFVTTSVSFRCGHTNAGGHNPSAENPPKMLPKNGELRSDSVGFCRLSLCNIALCSPPGKLTTVVSIKSAVSRGTRTAGMRFALYLATYKIGFPGWPEPILDSVTGFGASIAKRGLAPAPFFISIGPLFSLARELRLAWPLGSQWFP